MITERRQDTNNLDLFRSVKKYPFPANTTKLENISQYIEQANPRQPNLDSATLRNDNIPVSEIIVIFQQNRGYGEDILTTARKIAKKHSLKTDAIVAALLYFKRNFYSIEKNKSNGHNGKSS